MFIQIILHIYPNLPINHFNAVSFAHFFIQKTPFDHLPLSFSTLLSNLWSQRVCKITCTKTALCWFLRQAANYKQKAILIVRNKTPPFRTKIIAFSATCKSHQSHKNLSVKGERFCRFHRLWEWLVGMFDLE